MMQATQCVSPTLLKRGGKSPNLTGITQHWRYELSMSSNQEPGAQTKLIAFKCWFLISQVPCLDKQPPDTWHLFTEMWVLSPWKEKCPRGWSLGNSKKQNIPSPKHKHIIKIHKTGSTAEWMKTPQLKTGQSPRDPSPETDCLLTSSPWQGL